ncbi:TetR family transcriptional regulator [Mycobacterium lentiflavum]|uniref:TetR family transcriptional regulator n=1 Tax=Mycobacterium lentiflavum TaxID=141349 RepID=A0A0E3WAZ6_MYCLN|nr:TetR/AcrR family transcriptional regulator [Mycobacterium lentiflavum]MEE3065514.1 TetR/AcrR family transcriptional regulator [Actinomycetota bacterium]ULP42549.1 TetR/AcrR family transcriptional regulator [Mycobacterium lentiflavum]CQD02903.1 TetR family transcriptional regulator [Mycobacterium lentiflavum]
MPRGKTFDPEEKVDEALDLFWRRGCDAVSIQDLVEALELNRGSLYATYGDKEQLWRRALTRYCDQRRAYLSELLDDPTTPVLPRIRRLMLDTANPTAEGPHGCLIVNAITERTDDPATMDIVTGQISRVEDVLRKAFTRARSGGEIPAESSPRRLARFAVVTLQGLHVYDRALADPRKARDAVDVAMSAIRSGAVVDGPT